MKKILLLFLSIALISACNHTQHDIPIVVSKKGVYIPVTIQDTTIMMLWDIGASITIINRDLADKLGLEYDTVKSSSVSLFSTMLPSNHPSFNDDMKEATIPSYKVKKTKFRIGDNMYTVQPTILCSGGDKIEVLGNDFMHQFYYAVHLTDQKMSLSKEPISFSEFNIIDSLVLGSIDIDYMHRLVYNVQVGSDSLKFLVDSGMRLGMKYGSKSGTDSVYYDIVLGGKDSTHKSFRVFNDIKRKARVNLVQYEDSHQFHITYDSLFTINSQQIKSYIPWVNEMKYNSHYDGYITYGLISRFDIFYYDPNTRVIKLYKVKDYTSINRDVSIWEFIKRLNKDLSK